MPGISHAAAYTTIRIYAGAMIVMMILRCVVDFMKRYRQLWLDISPRATTQ